MIRLWRESTNDHTLAWNIPANVRRSYSQDTRQVQDAYDLPHVIRTRSNNRNVTGVAIRFPRGILADESGLAVLTNAVTSVTGSPVATGGHVPDGDHYYMVCPVFGGVVAPYVITAESAKVTTAGGGLSIVTVMWTYADGDPDYFNIYRGTASLIYPSSALVATAPGVDRAAVDTLASPGAGTPSPPPGPSTLQSLKSYLTEAYEERHYVTVFDEDGTRYYAGYLGEMDELILCNESEFDELDAIASFALIVTADGTYSDWDSLTTTLTPRSRP